MEKNAAEKHKNLLSRIKTRKMEQLRMHPYGTSMNGYTKNQPLNLDEHELKRRMKTLHERKTLDQARKRKTQRMKKTPLPVNQMEEFLGIKPVNPSQKREWNLDEAEFLRFQSASRHSDVRHSANNVKKSSRPVSQLTLENNEDGFYKKFIQNMPPGPRFTGRYASVQSPAHVWKSPRSQERYESVTKPISRPAPVRRGKKKTS